MLFEARPETKIQRGQPAERRPRAATADAKENAKLRQELAEATRYLQAVMQEHEAAHEELQASNEEILSANEELQSINEELETATEEVQSSNEELATLNQEMQDRNLQLGRALDYSNGIVETVRNPLLILDAGLRVERANRAFYGHFRVAPEETAGRLLYELGNGQWDIPPLRQALEEELPRGGRSDGFRGGARIPAGSAAGFWRSTPASCITTADGRAFSWLSRTRHRRRTRRRAVTPCWPWNMQGGCVPRRRTGSRTSLWPHSRTSCEDP